KVLEDERQAIKLVKVAIIPLPFRPEIKPEPVPNAPPASRRRIENPSAAVSGIESEPKPTNTTPSSQDRARDFLRSILTDKPVAQSEVLRRRRNQGIPDEDVREAADYLRLETVNRKANDQLIPCWVYVGEPLFDEAEAPLSDFDEAEDIALESPVSEDSASIQPVTIATEESIGTFCPKCKAAITIEEGENYRHSFCS